METNSQSFQFLCKKLHKSLVAQYFTMKTCSGMHVLKLNAMNYPFFKIFHKKLKIAISDVSMATSSHFQNFANSIIHCGVWSFCKILAKIYHNSSKGSLSTSFTVCLGLENNILRKTLSKLADAMILKNTSLFMKKLQKFNSLFPTCMKDNRCNTI